MDTTLPDASAPAPANSANFFSSNAALAGATGTEDSASKIKVTEPPKFELESYISNYKGRTRFNRLYLIGITSTVLATDALKLAIAEAQSGKDVGRYDRSVRALAEVAPSEKEASLDSVWVQDIQRSVRAQTDRLEGELRGYKNNLIKESIRMGNEDLGNHYYETGDLISASKAYSRMRDYCTTPNHVASMLFKLISVSMERNDWLGVQSYVHRLRNSSSKPEDLFKYLPKTGVALALAQMHQRSYLEAANTFLSIDVSLGETYQDVINPNDVAVYGGLCALASMDRNELQQRVLDNNSFRNFLELEPHIRRAITFFCNSKFRLCLDILEAYRADYLLDLHLQPHVNDLYSRIRTKSIQQYLVPFSNVTLESMATIFAPGVVGGQAQPIGLKSPFVQELIRLIKDDILQARIDLEKGLLVSNQANLRADVQSQALESLKDFNREVHWRLLRNSVINAGPQAPPTAADRRQRRGPDVGLGMSGDDAFASLSSTA
ncbi:COP9 signalosome subunit 1 (CsnA) [Penicillium angulare]|uniref:COP9 signalosome subunit 1 (CsnA) n=1 Tax=Penicillium angulare TaxID=116970 RepID=UPI00253F9B6F|nr:COP9 signalosome subunit 1 (CsnA) [Penicillium angulare]KAJ5291067.1 COP9 signalosome subunit 1 (CsnA) [Penicillium angulare]